MKKHILLIILILTLLSLNVYADTGVFIKEHNLTSKILIKKGMNVDIVSETDDTYEILLYKKKFIVNKNLILKNKIITKVSGIEQSKEVATTAYLTKDIILKFPNGETLTIKRGTKVPVYDYADGKFKLKDDNSNEYSLSEDSISFFEPENLDSEISSSGNTKKRQERLVKASLEKLGLPYVWGGTSPIYGFDCSGFTQYLYKQIGVNLPRTANGQARVGKSVKQSELMVGDLLFFGFNGVVDHMGMYIGRDYFIHSSRGGMGVNVESIYSNYSTKHIMFSKRVM